MSYLFHVLVHSRHFLPCLVSTELDISHEARVRVVLDARAKMDLVEFGSTNE